MDRRAWWATVHGVAKESDMTLPFKLKFLFHRNREKVLNIIWNYRRPQIAKAIIREKNIIGDITLPDH